jgi:hypothetical protein
MTNQSNMEIWSDLYTDPKVKRMNTEQPMEDRLWDYIDGRCSPTEKSVIEELLATNREWQQKHRELLNLQQLLDNSELEAPSLRFTKNVMEEIARYHVAPATKSYVNKNVIRGIGAFFLTMILGVLGFTFTQFKWTTYSGSGGSSGNPLNLPTVNLGLARLNNVSKAFNSTYIIGFLLIAVVLGFMLLDMYLQQKKNQQAV